LVLRRKALLKIEDFMGFRSSLLASLTIAIIGVCLLGAYANNVTDHNLNNPKGVKIIAEMCKESLNLALSKVQSIRNWPPTAQFRVDIEDATPDGKDAPSVQLKVNARVIAYAYYDLTTNNDNDRLKSALAILEGKEWLLIENGIVCNAPYDEASFVSGTVPRIAAGLNRFLSQNGVTSFLYKFAKRFSFHFYSMDMDIGRKLLEKGRTLSHETMFGEMYVDSSFSELQIFTDSYALMWNPKKEILSEVAEKLLEGVMDPQKHLRFTATIKIAGKTEEEIDGEIDTAAKKAADAVLNYLKAVSKQREI
jgi:hypothetical protein